MLVRGRLQALILLSLDVAECVYFQLVLSVQQRRFVVSQRDSTVSLLSFFFFPSITEVAESGVTCSSFLIIHALWNAGRLAEEEEGKKKKKEKWRAGWEEAKYWSSLSKLSATFKLLWTTAGILPASDGLNSLLHCSPQPLSPLFSSFLTLLYSFLTLSVCVCVCVCVSVCFACVSTATGSGFTVSHIWTRSLCSFIDSQRCTQW